MLIALAHYTVEMPFCPSLPPFLPLIDLTYKKCYIDYSTFFPSSRSALLLIYKRTKL